MRYKLLIAGAGIAGLLLLVQAFGVFGAGPRIDRSQSAPIVSVAITPIKQTQSAGRPTQTAAQIAAARATTEAALSVIPPAQSESAAATATQAAAPEGALRRMPVLPTVTPLPNGAQPRLLNGLPIDMVVVTPDDVKQNVRQIYAQGRALGRNPNAFAKVGDSTMLWPLFLVNFDWGHYQLGNFGLLQRTITRFAGFFSRESLAVRKGMHSWDQFDPALADPKVCLSGEGPLACELRITNASFAIIRLGANDSLTPQQFEPAMRRILQTCIGQGVVPILGTKPDHYEGPENTINQLIRRLAAEYRIPLWDFDLLAETVPGRGLQPDGLHLVEGGVNDYTTAATIQFIGPLADLSALLILDASSQAAGGK
jgi:hypothetical protein